MAGVVSALCLTPWLARLALSPVAEAMARPEEGPAAFPLGLVTGGADGLVLAAALGGAAFGLARGRRAAAVLVGWLGVSLFVANPHWLGLPVNPVLGSGALAIALFLPLAVLAGLLASEVSGDPALRPLAAGRPRRARAGAAGRRSGERPRAE